MRQYQIDRINEMRITGCGPTAIAEALGLSVNTIKSHIRRHPELPGILLCKSCGKPIAQTPGRKSKHFCNNKCRNTYWNHKYKEERNGM